MALFEDTGYRYAFGGASILVGLFTIFVAFRSYGKKREVEDTPTSKIRSISAGLVELNGKVIPREILRAPFSKKQCVFYTYKLEREFVRREWDPMTKRMLTIREWKTMRSESDSRRFFLQDETGKVLVDPKDAEVQDISTYNLWRVRHTENLVVAYSNIYLLGTATENPEKGPSENWEENILIKKGEVQKDFVITSKSEKDVATRYLIQFVISLFVALALLVVGAWIIFIN